MAETLSPDEFANWIKASDAFNAIVHAFGERSLAARAILKRLQMGLIKSCAENSEAESRGRSTGLVERHLISKDAWERVARTDYPSTLSFWTTNDGSLSFGDYGSGGVTLSMFGLRFDPEGVRSLLPTPQRPQSAPPNSAPTPPQPAAPQNSPKKNVGGAPTQGILGRPSDRDVREDLRELDS
jgi:hypothetical protein